MKHGWFLNAIGGNAFIESHIEHHLFPTLSNNILTKIRPIIIKYLKKDVLDYVLCPSTGFSEASLERYKKKNQVPVVEKHPEKLKNLTKAAILWADVASETELVRHDSLKLAAAVKKIIQEEKTR